ncbi:MAG: hypothetical protein RIK87_03360 [Fuerstiella sp.]
MFRTKYPVIVACLTALLLLPAPIAVAAEGPANFVFLLVDNLGWANVGCNSSTVHETPHIDALAVALPA